MVDTFAPLALRGIAFHVTVTALSPNVALVLRSFPNAIFGLCFLTALPQKIRKSVN